MAMKVAHVYTNYTAFSNPYLRTLSHELVRGGIDVSCFSRIEARNGERGCIPLRMFAGGRDLRSDLLTGCVNVPKIVRSVASREEGGKRSLRGKIRQWCDLLPLLREKWDIVHIMNWPLYRLLAPYLEESRAKFVLSFRGYETLYGIEQNETWRNDVRKVIEHASALHFVSDFLAEKGIEKGASPSKVMVIRPGVDVNFFQPKERRPNKEICKIATVCRLTWEKGLEIGLLAVNRLKRRGVPVVYHVIGDGPSGSALRCWADRLKLEEAVRWHGSLTSVAVRDVLEDCDVYLHPSVSEAFGVAIVEAMAMGLPVVASRIQGIPEIIRHDETGYLLDFGDIQGIAEAIEKTWMDSEVWHRMSNEARREAVARFSLAREVKEWVNLYTMLCSRD